MTTHRHSRVHDLQKFPALYTYTHAVPHTRTKIEEHRESTEKGESEENQQRENSKESQQREIAERDTHKKVRVKVSRERSPQRVSRARRKPTSQVSTAHLPDVGGAEL